MEKFNHYTDNISICKPLKGSKLEDIKLMITDIDGCMTDGGLYYDDNGNEQKKFNTKDAAGFFALKVSGVAIMAITGRSCEATRRRMTELQVDYLHESIVNKKDFIIQFIKDNNLSFNNLAYFGDDLNDLHIMKLCMHKGCPNDAAEEVYKIFDFRSKKNGGDGAVRDFASNILKDRGQWDKAIQSVYRMGV